MCADKRCCDGVTTCMGPNGCNGHGALSPRGGRYRQRRTAALPGWAVAHHECHGTGRVKCGCRRTLTAEQKTALAGAPWRNGERRWSSLRGQLLTSATCARRARAAIAPAARPAIAGVG
jgi:hypothetical protein